MIGNLNIVEYKEKNNVKEAIVFEKALLFVNQFCYKSKNIIEVF